MTIDMPKIGTSALTVNTPAASAFCRVDEGCDGQLARSQHHGRRDLRGAARSGRAQGLGGAIRQRAGDRHRRAIEHGKGSADRGVARALSVCFCGLLACLSAVVPHSALARENVKLPSGAEAYLYEVIGQGTGELRLRYVSAGFKPGALAPDDLLADMTFLCENNALVLDGRAGGLERAIVSMADREAEFGVLNTDVRQSFEAFTLDETTCIWEAF